MGCVHGKNKRHVSSSDGSPRHFRTERILSLGRATYRIVATKTSGEGEGKMYDIRCRRKSSLRTLDAVEAVCRERVVVQKVRGHSNVHKCVWCLDDPLMWSFVYEMIDGENLRRCMDRNGKMIETVVQTIVQQLASAVAHYHSVGVLHRSIHPSNVLIGADARVLLTDLNSSATLMTDDESGPSEQCWIVDGYAAPEAYGPEHYTSSDWFSVGVCAYELIFARKPYTG